METKKLYPYEKINKFDKFLARLINKNEEKQILNIQKWKEDNNTEITDVKE